MLATLMLAALAQSHCPDADHYGNRDCKTRLCLAIPVEPDPYRTHMLIYGPGEGDFAYLFRSDKIYHQSDPLTRLTPRDLDHRPVWRCYNHYNGPIQVVGGMPPRDFAMAVAQEEWVGPGRGQGVALTWVHKGLADPSYHTRQAAFDCLVRLGEKAIGPCLDGLRSKDAEVRWRCHLILERIRVGDVGVILTNSETHDGTPAQVR